LSHLKERKEKICLNCNAALYGRYCHVCGQENLEPKESVWHLVNHFFEDITHFDGKFFSTVKYLITKPGFLSKEYMQGRRASYLNPIRMYVFTSAFFFIVLFSTTSPDKIMKLEEKPDKETVEGIGDWEKKIAKLEKELKTYRENKDKDTTETVVEIRVLEEKIAVAKKMYGDTTTRKFTNTDAGMLLLRANLDSLNAEGVPPGAVNKIHDALAKRDSSGSKEGRLTSFGFFAGKYASPEAYDSAQQKLPAEKRDGWLKRISRRKMIVVNNEYKKDQRGYFEHFRENFLHSFPKILFLSLPFFALILKFVYVRRKQFFYTSHGIFTIHLYCSTFILMLITIISSKLQDAIPWKWLQIILVILNVAVIIYMFIYLYKAMRKFYGQGRFKTFVKYLLVSFLAMIVNLVLIVLFTLISAISI
jgi:hypothetical protein